MSLLLYVWVVVESMYTCKDGNFRKRYFLFMVLLLYRVCTYVRLVILETIRCVYVCFVVEGVYTFKTSHFGDDHFYSCLCCKRGYVHM